MRQHPFQSRDYLSSRRWPGLLFVLVMAPAGLFAAGTGMPWEGPLAAFLASLTGPVAQAFSIGAITLTGLGLAFGQTQGMMLRLLQIAFGLSIAFAAAGFFLPLFGFGGGAVF